MAEHGDSQELSEEAQLKDQLERICLDYQTLVNNSREMAPKGTNSKKTDPNAENNIEDDDFEGTFLHLFVSIRIHIKCLYLEINLDIFFFIRNQLIEIANVADNLDSLESALDLIEERADRIREQLLQLLTSNREIRQSLQEENNKLREDQSKEESEASTSSTPEQNDTEPNPQ